jgi:protein-tyrosine kinase
MWHAMEIDALYNAHAIERSRVIGFIGVQRGSGTSTIAAAVARRMALTRRDTLMLDLSHPSASDHEQAVGWIPGDGYAVEHVDHDHEQFNQLVATPTMSTKFAFSDTALIRTLLDRDLKSYATIIVDLPAIGGTSAVDGTFAAMACDSVFLICAPGHTSRALLTKAGDTLRSARVPLAGVILNDRDHPTLATELEREVRRLRRFFPRLCDALAERLMRTPWLSVRC